MANHDAHLILEGVIKEDKKNPEYNGFWEYGNGHGEDLKKGPRHLDHSISQYGILGLWAAAKMASKSISRNGRLFENAWKSHQFPDGGWQYDGYPGQAQSKSQETASMTAAGIATLFITEEFLHSDDGVNCGGNITNPAIEKGLKWMTDNFSKVGNNVYTLYGAGAHWRRQRQQILRHDRLVCRRRRTASSKPRRRMALGPAAGSPRGTSPSSTPPLRLLFLSRGRRRS